MRKYNILGNIKLYLNTFRYLKPEQVYYRILNNFKRKTGILRKKHISTTSVFTDKEISKIIDIRTLQERPIKYSESDKVLENKFSFLNKEVYFNDEIDWVPEKTGKLWTFNLNYFDYLPELGRKYQETKKQVFYKKFEELVKDWIGTNKIVRGEPWHPYPTSRRIVNWILSYYLFKDKIDKEKNFKNIFLKSLYFQTSYLNKNPEYDVMANHLLTNAKSLLFGGLFFGNTDWANKGRKILKEQIYEQILSDGGHFERSPMYHCEILFDVLDCINIVNYNSKFNEFLKSTAGRMLSFLEGILLPDGNIPLFSDSSSNGIPEGEQIFAYAKSLSVEWESNKSRILKYPESGYYIMKDENEFMIIDGGKIGADYQPGHGHCDLFSYEYLIDNEKIIVDSGNYGYETGEIRDYCRSTGAHNTVMIDGNEQSEIWASFRVARRAVPKQVKLIESGKIKTFMGFYSPAEIPGVIHKRWIHRVGNDFWIILDKIENKYSKKSKHEIENFIHLHPDIKIKCSNDKIFLNTKSNKQLTIIPFNTKYSLIDGYYCPEFGKKIKNEVINFNKKEKLPFFLGYLIIPEKIKKGNVKLSGNGKISLDIHLDGTNYTLKFNG